MNPAQSISSVFSQYFGFNGRASRSEYWWFFLFQFIIAVVLSIVIPILYWIYFLGTIIPYLAVAIRRLHDTGRSGWWILIGLVPIFGGIILLVFFVIGGDRGQNRYGPDPLQPTPGMGIEEGAANQSPQGAAAFCTSCGSAMAPSASYCRSCGAAV